jgi:quercetin dioxygenase-like cupin family protein
MELVHPTEIASYDADRLVAIGVLSATSSNVRMIRLSPGQALPPHTHGSSDLFLYVIEGAGELDTSKGPVPIEAGDLAQYRGDEELRVANTGQVGMTMLAFLAPVFPPVSTS